MSLYKHSNLTKGTKWFLHLQFLVVPGNKLLCFSVTLQLHAWQLMTPQPLQVSIVTSNSISYLLLCVDWKLFIWYWWQPKPTCKSVNSPLSKCVRVEIDRWIHTHMHSYINTFPSQSFLKIACLFLSVGELLTKTNIQVNQTVKLRALTFHSHAYSRAACCDNSTFRREAGGKQHTSHSLRARSAHSPAAGSDLRLGCCNQHKPPAFSILSLTGEKKDNCWQSQQTYIWANTFHNVQGESLGYSTGVGNCSPLPPDPLEFRHI